MEGRHGKSNRGAAMKTLLVALTHPDDEVGCVGTIAAQRAAGDRVVLLWLTRGEATEVYGEMELDEVARRRVAQGRQVAERLGCEARFLALPDTRVAYTPDAAREVAAAIADVRPDAVVTWGDAWVRGMRHPDHQATGQIVRAAVTLARLGRVVAPAAPHREPVPVYTLRDEHSTLPVAAIDVAAHVDTILDVAAFYRERVGWPEEAFLRERLERAGAATGLLLAERFDVWDGEPGVRRTLI